jgi:LDH2 family malate/lactate/ureidoglycolate dehydrogenase
MRGLRILRPDTMTTTVSAERLRRFIADAFRAVGMAEADARIVAELMTEADLYGADGHGVFRVPHYVRRIRAGGVNLEPNIRVVREKPGMALVDGDNGMGHLVMRFATRTAIEKARASGVAWVGVRMSNHAGPALLYARMAAAAGMCGLYCCVGNANHLAPWGGLELLLSTNPIAVAVPTLDQPMVVLDMATTVAAFGKIKTYAQAGKPMPEGWMIDLEGRPLTDAKRANEGLALPLGGMEAGYKGYGLALVLGLLAGCLNGAAMGRDVIDFNADDASVTNTGHAIVAIDPAAFGDPTEFKRRVDRVVRDLRGSKRLPGVERITVPGERSGEKRAARSTSGVPIPPPLRAALDKVAGELGIAALGA